MIFYDILPLPSEGVFYKDKLSEIQVNFLTTEDQLLLTSPNIINLGKVIPYILKNKIVGIEDYNNLLVQDINAILLYIRELAIGDKIHYTLNGVEKEVDFSEFTFNEMFALPNADGKYIMAEDDIVYEFSPLTYGEFKEYESIKNESNHDTLYTSFIIKKIIHNDVIYEGVNNISEFIRKLPRIKYINIKKVLEKYLKFGYDMSVDIMHEENPLNIKVKIDEYFFSCSVDTYLEYQKLIIKEINILVTDGKYGYNDLLSMPSHHRRLNCDALVENIQAKIKESKSK